MEQNKEPRNKFTHHGQFIFDKGGNTTHWGKTVCSIYGAGKLEYPYVMRLDPSLSPYAKINSKWIKDVMKKKYETTRRKYRGNASQYWAGQVFLNETSKHRQQKKRHITSNSKVFCTAKETKQRDNLQNERKHLQTTSDKRYLKYILKELQNKQTKKTLK